MSAATKFDFMHAEWKKENWVVTTDPARQDVDAIHAFLTRAYWCEGIPQDIVERAVRNSLCFGLFEGTAQIGLARAVTDYATYAYLCDVYVRESHRGRGLGKWLIECVMAHPSLQGLRRFNLATRDAHDLYTSFGFQPLARPDNHMEKHKPDIYKADTAVNRPRRDTN